MTLNIHKLTHLSYSDIPPSMPRLPLLVIKYIATFLQDKGKQDVEMIISLFKAFTLGIEYDDKSTIDYKQTVWKYLSVIMQESLNDWYYFSTNTPYLCLKYNHSDNINSTQQYSYNLSPLDLAWVYEVSFADHYSQSYYDPDTFLKITDLLECNTTLCENEEIMGFISYPINIKDLKYFNLLEKALICKRDDLIMFIYENLYSPIMAFYLYLKHNHVDYKTKENSLANDDRLMNLLRHVKFTNCK